VETLAAEHCTSAHANLPCLGRVGSVVEVPSPGTVRIPSILSMKPDPDLPIRFANTILEELAQIRAELLSQRKLLIEISSRQSKEPRRKIKDRAYDDRKSFFSILREAKKQVGLPPKSGGGDE
jgi:hypothetical protein